MDMREQFDAVVVNGDLDQAVEETLEHIDEFIRS